MELTCKHCGSRFRAAIQLPLVAPVRVACPACRTQMTLKPAAAEATPGAPAASAASAASRFPESPVVDRRAARPAAAHREPPRVETAFASIRRQRVAVVADDDRPFRTFLVKELRSAGFDVTTFESGDEALEFIRRSRAELAIVNVYLKGKLGVEITEEIKSDHTLGNTRVILIGALFRANRFRANPTNLYGADEYIEEQIPEREFQELVARLFPGAEQAPAPSAEPHEIEEARRLARLILSDIVIYHAAKADRGIAEDNFFEVLRDEIDEGRHYFESRVSEHVRSEGDLFTETIQQFVDMKREELERLRGVRASER